MPFKLCIIGAGSVGFTRKLCSDILKVPEFEGIEIALTDISQHNLDMIAQILRKMVEVSGLQDQGHRHHRPPQGAGRREIRDEHGADRRASRPSRPTSPSR